MIMRLLSQIDNDVESFEQKRRYERRECDQCVAEIDGKAYPVINWSQGGALIFMDERLLTENDRIDLTMKFHVQDRIIPISNTAHVVRKSNSRIALGFETNDDVTRQNFQQIIGDITTREFADSQA